MTQISDTSEITIRAKVIEIFERCREVPNSPYDASRFLAFLTAAQSFDSLKTGDGRKSFYRFYDAVEDEFQIFISERRIRKDWDLDAFVTYLERAIKGRKSGAKGAAYYNERMIGCAVPIVLMFGLPLFGLLFVVLVGLTNGWIAGVIVAPLAALPTWRYFLKDYLRYRKISKSNRA